VLTSRVHPGETPASYVFNGFLEFILNRTDLRARILRKHFVFKLIPLLNPDGVYRGHYRTDQLGMNLNRVYLDPSFLHHPSIYAAKSLIIYHHIHNRIGKSTDGLNFSNIFETKSNRTPSVQPPKDSETPTPDHPINFSNDHSVELAIDNELYLTLSTGDSTNRPSHEQRSDEATKDTPDTKKHRQTNAPTNSAKPNKIVLTPLDKKRSTSMLGTKSKMSRSRQNDADHSDNDDGTAVPVNKGKHSPHLNDPRLLLINPLHSGIAFYVDLHGHAAKRGCFIYGNSIDNEVHQVENVLFPKLISFNSQHFDFDGCNFSVKNMYYKDKREGLSKEGSGRVALFKTIGLIHSYTLECCYASGRVMNVIAPASNANGRISPPMPIDMPPKFLPEHFQNVGKGMAIAVLDMYDLNPFTRIPNTTFGSLDSVRNWVKFFIRSKLNQNFSSNNMSNKKSLLAGGRSWTRPNGNKNGQQTSQTGEPSRKPFSFAASSNNNNSNNKHAANAKQTKKPNIEPSSNTPNFFGKSQAKNSISKPNMDPKDFVLKQMRHALGNNVSHTKACVKTSDEKTIMQVHEAASYPDDENICDSDDDSDYGAEKDAPEKDPRIAVDETAWLVHNVERQDLDKETEDAIKELLYDSVNKEMQEFEATKKADNDTNKTDDSSPKKAELSASNYNNPFREIFQPKQNILRLNLSAKTVKNDASNSNLQKVVDLIALTSAVTNNTTIIKPFSLKSITKSYSLNNHLKKPNITRNNTVAFNPSTAAVKVTTTSSNLVKTIASIRKMSSNTGHPEANKNILQTNSKALESSSQTFVQKTSIKPRKQHIKNQLQQVYSQKKDRSQDSLPLKVYHDPSLNKFMNMRNSRRQIIRNDINQVI
jgi:hypothetical protein